MTTKRMQSYILNGLRLLFDWDPGKSIDDTWCRRPAMGVLALGKELGLGKFETLVDVGAHESQFARWLKTECPKLEVISFEPDTRRNPIGTVKRLALGDRGAMVGLTSGKGVCAYTVAVTGGNIPMVRYDSLAYEIKKPAVLKIDTESDSLKTLLGFGNRIKDFSIVVVEVQNCQPFHPHLLSLSRTALIDTCAFMRAHRFGNSRVLDSGPYVPERISHLDIAFWA